MTNLECKTKSAYLWTNVFKAPFWALYGLLVFILYKDLHATSIQVATFLALKPIVSVFSIYWSHSVTNRRDRLIPNIIAASLLGYFPFFFFPFVSNPWFFIFAGALYMMLMRGIVPAWMEILKINLPIVAREKVFSYGSSISYLGTILFPLILGDILDTSPGVWKWLFPATALIGLLSIFFQLRIPIPKNENSAEQFLCAEKQHSMPSCAEYISRPWKTVCICLKSAKTFVVFR